jgi:hypothetical protein
MSTDYWPWKTFIYDQYGFRFTQLRKILLLYLQDERVKGKAIDN